MRQVEPGVVLLDFERDGDGWYVHWHSNDADHAVLKSIIERFDTPEEIIAAVVKLGFSANAVYSEGANVQEKS